jgi:hypothetical protein
VNVLYSHSSQKKCFSGPKPEFARAVLAATVVGGLSLSTQPIQQNLMVQVETFFGSLYFCSHPWLPLHVVKHSTMLLWWTNLSCSESTRHSQKWHNGTTSSTRNCWLAMLCKSVGWWNRLWSTSPYKEINW